MQLVGRFCKTRFAGVVGRPESDRGIDSRVRNRAVVSRTPGLARRMPEPRDSPDERARHLDKESLNLRVQGALIGPNDQGLAADRAAREARLALCLERSAPVPGNREIEIVEPGSP